MEIPHNAKPTDRIPSEVLANWIVRYGDLAKIYVVMARVTGREFSDEPNISYWGQLHDAFFGKYCHLPDKVFECLPSIDYCGVEGMVLDTLFPKQKTKEQEQLEELEQSARNINEQIKQLKKTMEEK
jgi:hypothetical protein